MMSSSIRFGLREFVEHRASGLPAIGQYSIGLSFRFPMAAADTVSLGQQVGEDEAAMLIKDSVPEAPENEATPPVTPLAKRRARVAKKTGWTQNGQDCENLGTVAVANGTGGGRLGKTGNEQYDCVKCQRQCTFAGSTPSGSRNEERRVCFKCGATDKNVERKCKGPVRTGKRAKEPLTDDDLEIMKKAKALKTMVQKMKPDEKAAWYRSQNDARDAEGSVAGRPRGLDDSKGKIEESKEDYDDVCEYDWHQPFSIWGADKIKTGEAKDWASASALWVAALEEPGADVITARGEKLLGVFQGVKSSQGSRGALKQALSQSGHLSDEQDMERFRELATAASDRYRKNRTNELQSGSAIQEPSVPNHMIDSLRDISMVRLNCDLKTASAQIAKEMQRKEALDREEDEKLLAMAESLKAEQQAKKDTDQESKGSSRKDVDKKVEAINAAAALARCKTILSASVSVSLASFLSLKQQWVDAIEGEVEPDIVEQRDAYYQTIDDAVVVEKKQHGTALANARKLIYDTSEDTTKTGGGELEVTAQLGTLLWQPTTARLG